MNIIRKAYEYSAKIHEGQIYNGGAFIFHPMQTAEILKVLVRNDDNLLAAGYLHDVIEDCGITHKELKKEFNEDIADLVREVTKDGYNVFPYLKTRRGAILKFADRLTNLYNMDMWDEAKQLKYINKSKFWETGVKGA